MIGRQCQLMIMTNRVFCYFVLFLVSCQDVIKSVKEKESRTDDVSLV